MADEGLPSGIIKTASGKYGGRPNIHGKRQWTGSFDTVAEAQAAFDKMIEDNHVTRTTRHQSPTNAKDLTGRVFGHLTVVGKSDKRAKDGGIMWECLCDCGNTTLARGADLIRGHHQSCGHVRDDLVQSNVARYKEIVEDYDHTSPERLAFQGIQKNNTSGEHNICIVHTKTGDKFVIRVGFKGKQVYGGRYSTMEEAIHARDVLQDKLWGDTIDRYRREQPRKK